MRPNAKPKRNTSKISFETQKRIQPTQYDLGSVTVAPFRIKLTGEPIKQRPYKTPGHIKPQILEQLKEMERHNIIKISQSPYASPLVTVLKPNGEIRLCT